MLSIDQCYACGHCSYASCILQAMRHQILQAMWSNLWEKMSLGNNGSLLTVISGTWQIYCILVVNCHRIINKSNLIGEEKYSLSYQNKMVKIHV